MVLVCEQEGFIPRYYTDEPGDKVDETLADMKKYTRSLVTEEMNLGNLIESAVREMAREEAKAEDEDTDDDLTFEEVDQLRQDEDYSELQDFIEDEEKADEELLHQLAEDPL